MEVTSLLKRPLAISIHMNTTMSTLTLTLTHIPAAHTSGKALLHCPWEYWSLPPKNPVYNSILQLEKARQADTFLAGYRGS
jgi:hypothetical protein